MHLLLLMRDQLLGLPPATSDERRATALGFTTLYPDYARLSQGVANQYLSACGVLPLSLWKFELLLLSQEELA